MAMEGGRVRARCCATRAFARLAGLYCAWRYRVYVLNASRRVPKKAWLGGRNANRHEKLLVYRTFFFAAEGRASRSAW